MVLHWMNIEHNDGKCERIWKKVKSTFWTAYQPLFRCWTMYMWIVHTMCNVSLVETLYIEHGMITPYKMTQAIKENDWKEMRLFVMKCMQSPYSFALFLLLLLLLHLLDFVEKILMQDTQHPIRVLYCGCENTVVRNDWMVNRRDW